MPRYALIVDVKKCVGCFACRVACQNQNSLPAETAFIRFEDHETGKYPKVKYEILTLQCMHCESAPCVPVCPTNASAKDKETGLTLVNPDKCIGCRRCVVACPYHARHYVKDSGVAQGCNLCLAAQGGPGAGLCLDLPDQGAAIRRPRRPERRFRQTVAASETLAS